MQMFGLCSGTSRLPRLVFVAQVEVVVTARGSRALLAKATGIFVATRVVLLATVSVLLRSGHRTLLQVLTRLDGVWYIGIARNGYRYTPHLTAATHVKSNAAFFSLYPATIRLFAWPLGYQVGALMATFVAGCVASSLIASWAASTLGIRGSLATVAMWALWPSSAVLSMAYSEALFTATVAGCLLAMQRGRWGWAAFACALAGLTRPSAAALVLALAVGLWQASISRREKFLWLVAGGSGLAASLAYISILTGRLTGWLVIEQGWNSGLDFGVSALNRMLQVFRLKNPDRLPPDVVATVVVIAVVVFLVLLWRDRSTPLRERVFATALFAMVFAGANYFHCKPRFLLPNLPVFTVPARWWSGQNAILRWSLVAVAVVASTGWNAYLIAVWPLSI